MSYFILTVKLNIDGRRASSNAAQPAPVAVAPSAKLRAPGGPGTPIAAVAR